MTYDDSLISCCRVPVDIKDTEYTVKGLTPGKSYEFRVAAVNEAGPGQYAETKEAIKASPPPSELRHSKFRIN